MSEVSSASTADRYHAFLSYSHADAAVARGVQKALLSIGRRVGRSSALRVFRDDTDLSASPDLWGRVRQAMDAAGHLIVVLSPNAAASEWVDREVAHWLDTRGAERLLFVLAAGTAAYDEAGGRFEPGSDAVPPALLRPGVLVTEPVYVDVRADAPWDAGAPGFRDRVMSLAAEIQGRPKSELAGDDLREQNRYRRWRRMVMGALSVLTVVSLLLAMVAISQRTEATRQRDQAVGLALAAAAQELVGVNDPLAVALASEAMAATDTPRWQAIKALVAARVSLADQRVVRVGAPMSGASGPIVALALSPDGRLLASGENGAVRLWDTVTRQQVGAPLVQDGLVRQLAFSPDGGLLASAANGTIVLWDPVQGSRLREIQTGLEAVYAIAFSPDGTMLASGGRGVVDAAGIEVPCGVSLWDPRSGVPVGRPLIGDSFVRDVSSVRVESVYSLTFSPDGRRLAVGYDGWIDVWTPSTRKLARRLVLPPEEDAGDGQAVLSLAFTASAQLVSVSNDFYARLWNPNTGALVRHFQDAFFSHYNYASSLSPDGSHLIGSWGLWETGSGVQLYLALFGSDRAAAFSPDGSRFALGSVLGDIQVFELRAADPVARTMRMAGPEITSMAFSSDGGMVGVVRGNGTASLVDSVTGQVIRELVPIGDFAAELVQIGPTGTTAIAGTRSEGPDRGNSEVRLIEPGTDQPRSARIHRP